MLEKQRDKCARKKRYADEVAANFFAAADGLRAYPCPVCSGWHLTSSKVKKGIKNWVNFKKDG